MFQRNLLFAFRWGSKAMIMGKSAVLRKASFGVTTAFVAAAMLQAASAFAGDTVYYYSSDTVHSEVVVTDQNRNVVERTYYAPYGQVLNRDLRDGPGYGGHEEDPETNLVYMQQRYYDPEAGRFLSVDPVQASGDGGSFNRYEYAKDNPYRYTDPDGRCVVCVVILGAIIAGAVDTSIQEWTHPSRPVNKTEVAISAVGGGITAGSASVLTGAAVEGTVTVGQAVLRQAAVSGAVGAGQSAANDVA